MGALKTSQTMIFGSEAAFIQRCYAELGLRELLPGNLIDGRFLDARAFENVFVPNMFNPMNNHDSNGISFYKHSKGPYVIIPKLLEDMDEYYFTKSDNDEAGFVDMFSNAGMNNHRFDGIIKRQVFKTERAMYMHLYHEMGAWDMHSNVNDNGWLSGVRFHNRPSICDDATKFEYRRSYSDAFECYVTDYRAKGITDILKTCTPKVFQPKA
jgi:hypothetical protein